MSQQVIQTAAGQPAAANRRLQLSDPHDPRGPDGQGRNRLGIWSMSPTPRCSLRPQTRQAALDTARGMAALGSITSYGDCTSNEPCASCSRQRKARDPWNPNWCLREDQHGNVWLLGTAASGFSGRGYCFTNWEKLFYEIDVPMLKRQQDSIGFYWTAA